MSAALIPKEAIRLTSDLVFRATIHNVFKQTFKAVDQFYPDPTLKKVALSENEVQNYVYAFDTKKPFQTLKVPLQKIQDIDNAEGKPQLSKHWETSIKSKAWELLKSKPHLLMRVYDPIWSLKYSSNPGFNEQFDKLNAEDQNLVLMKLYNELLTERFGSHSARVLGHGNIQVTDSNGNIISRGLFTIPSVDNFASHW